MVCCDFEWLAVSMIDLESVLSVERMSGSTALVNLSAYTNLGTRGTGRLSEAHSLEGVASVGEELRDTGNFSRTHDSLENRWICVQAQQELSKKEL